MGPHAISTRETDTAEGRPLVEVCFAVGILLVLAAVLASVTCLGIRLRRSQGQVRQQVRIVAVGAASVGLGLFVLLGNEAIHGGSQQSWSSLLLYASYAFLIACIAVAVLRYRLYDVELFISRGFVVAVAAAFAAAGYIGLVVGLGRAAGERSGGFWASLVAMTAVALAFQPLRRAVVRLADRLAYGPRAAPYDALASFSRRIGRSPAPGAVLPAIAAAAGQAVAAERAVVRLTVDAGEDLVEVWPPGAAVPDETTGQVVPVADEHGALGSIALDVPAGRDVRPFEQRMLEDIADQAAVAFRNVRLQVELAAQVERLDERARALDASRRRLIDAADTERRRLESALAREVLPAMDSLRTDLADGPARVDEATAASYVERATAALEALRELTRGIYPTLLTRSGPVAALTSYADRNGRSTALSLDPGVAASRYAERVEAAVYFCCVEMLGASGDPGDVAVDLVDDDDRGDVPRPSTRRPRPARDGRSRGGGRGVDTPRPPTGSRSGCRPLQIGPRLLPHLLQALGAEGRLRHVRRGTASAAVELVLVVRRQQDDHGARREVRRRLDPTHAGEVDVQEHEVRVQLAGDDERLLAAGGGSDDDETGGLLHDRCHGAPVGVLVVHHEHTYVDHATISPSPSRRPRGLTAHSAACWPRAPAPLCRAGAGSCWPLAPGASLTSRRGSPRRAVRTRPRCPPGSGRRRVARPTRPRRRPRRAPVLARKTSTSAPRTPGAIVEAFPHTVTTASCCISSHTSSPAATSACWT